MLPVHIHNMLAVEEEEQLEEMREYNIQRRLLRDHSDPFSLNESHFINLFRLNKGMARYVYERILPQIVQAENVVAVSPVIKYFCALYFYATGSYQRTIGESLNMPLSQQMVSRCIHEVSNVIQEVLGNEWIRFPNIEDFNRVKGRFMEATQFPGVIGAIDCTHIAITAPHEEEHNYVNRKGYHSKNVQVVSCK